MPIRPNPLASGCYYHIFNRGVDKRCTFEGKKDYQRFIESIVYYMFQPKIRISEYYRLPQIARKEIRKAILLSPLCISLVSYCVMPNHFHFLLRQETENGISNYLRRLIESYTRYFNTIHKRKGHLFEREFKAVLIDSDEELLHVSRYIHLNPATAYLVSNAHENEFYPWSSLQYFIGHSPSYIHSEKILGHFKDGKIGYSKFVADQLDYQRTLNSIKLAHLEI